MRRDVYAAILGGRPGKPGAIIPATARRMAQVYNHMIMPLANSRDQATQVLWGIGDFEKRFGRDAGRHVAAGNRGGYRDARAAGRKWHSLHDPCAPSGGALRPIGDDAMARSKRRADRSDARLSAATAVGTNDRRCFSMTAPMSRAVAFEGMLAQRRAIRRPAERRLFPTDQRSAATRPHRHRRRDVRPSSSAMAIWRSPIALDRIERARNWLSSPTTASFSSACPPTA